MTGRTAIVIGAGIAGLATAALLADDGYTVTIVERGDDVGGRAGTWDRDGFRFDTGPSWYLMPDVFEHFFRLLGTTTERELDLVPLSPAYRVYSEGYDALDVPSGRGAASALFESIERGAGAKLERYLDSAADAYDLAVSRFLYDPYLGYAGLVDGAVARQLPRLARLLVEPLASRVERTFTDRRLRQILEYPAVFLGGSPYGVPSLYHLMSHLDLTDGVRYPQGGFTALIRAIERLVRARGVVIETGADVTAIDVVAGRARGVRLADGSMLAGDVVVSTADRHHTETALLDETHRELPESWWERRTPGPGALLILLGVRGELPELAHHTLLFTERWRENFDAIFGEPSAIPDPASLYVCRPSATDPTVAPAGHENLFVLVPVPADPSLGHGGIDGAGEAGIERAADAAIAQIASWCGVPDLVDRVVVRRTIAPADFADDLNAWRGTSLGLAHTLRQSAVFRPRNGSAKVPNLFHAGTSSLPGIGLPMCLISAELVAKRLRADRSAAPLVEPAGR
ncbi:MULTISPECIES: phytoene desaturase family protein [Microbacterium]|jgi:phytoene desaturase|uniref:phytoene desaturase family protein n=1 Tax=Microbacterium TaxID=33882 RepID=UPI0010F59329|nr:phytoene desaturase family protein [Microbacterium sp. 4NA327F11]MCK9916975.1 phytoene desaturase family protein [Microbacteriaceae bacterium K1510]